MAVIIFTIIITTIINVIMVHTFVTQVYDAYGDSADPEVARAFYRICLVPPIGIVVAAVCVTCLAIAWVIMMILDIWDR